MHGLTKMYIKIKIVSPKSSSIDVVFLIYLQLVIYNILTLFDFGKDFFEHKLCKNLFCLLCKLLRFN